MEISRKEFLALLGGGLVGFVILDSIKKNAYVTSHAFPYNAYVGYTQAGPVGGDGSVNGKITYMGYHNVNVMVAVGDITTNSSMVTNSKQMKGRPIILLLGDYFYKSPQDDPQNMYNALWNGYGGKIYALLGNHDVQREAQYKSLFGMSTWNFEFHVGNACFICINTQNPVSAAELDRRLIGARRAGKKFLIVAMHIPLRGYTNSVSDYFTIKDTGYESIMQKHRVDLALFGHSHEYLRFKQDAYGTTAVVVGTGDSELFTGLTGGTKTARRISNTVGFARIAGMKTNMLSFSFLDKNGATLDSINIMAKNRPAI